MNIILDLYYSGYRSHLYTLAEVLKVFKREGVFAEDLTDKGYDPKFVATIPSKNNTERLSFKKDPPLKYPMHIRDSTSEDESVLEELSDAFQLELYNQTCK